jgi:hypothetical protein
MHSVRQQVQLMWWAYCPNGRGPLWADRHRCWDCLTELLCGARSSVVRASVFEFSREVEPVRWDIYGEVLNPWRNRLGQISRQPVMRS